MVQENFTKLYEIIKEYMNEKEIEEINRALLFASKAHESQIRKSGEAYIIHPIAVSIILAKQKAPHEIIISGLLHDVVEDTPYTYDDIAENFSSEIADIVEGVTKLGSIEGYTYDQIQAENHRKIIISAAKDIRVIFIKLADRLHNMRTIGYMNQEKQKLIANETLEVYAPIAHRLGMYEMKWELEDLSFKCLNPQKYREIASKIEMKRSEREEIVEETLEYITGIMEEKDMHPVIKGRSKHIYSIYKKLNQGKQFEDILDLFAFRIIVKNISECYLALGIIHQYFKPLPFKFKDYIPTPKHNMYQSIHTTVLTKQGISMEFQIRTEKMNSEAEYGIASHWMYKENKDTKEFQKEVNQKLTWLRKILEEGETEKNSQTFMNQVKGDYLSKSIFLFTPKGDIIELPDKSTVLDFAFYVHTSVGNSALSAKVNGRVVSLFYQLEMGEVVNIITSPHAEPSLNWLSKVKTNRARESLKRYFKDVENKKIQEEGHKVFQVITKEHPELEIDENKMYSLLEELNIAKNEEFYYDLGLGEIASDEIVRILKDSNSTDGNRKDVLIEGLTGEYNTKFCNYCSPLPGDEIYATEVEASKIKQYYIHRKKCTQPGIRYPALFTEHSKGQSFMCRIEMSFDDEKKILSQILNQIAEFDHNITSVYGRGRLNGLGKCKISIEIENKKEFKVLKEKLMEIKGIEHVERVISKKRDWE